MDTRPRLTDILTDVSIREGSQQAVDLRNKSVAVKLELMAHTIKSGVKRIELTAFAPGEWFSDAKELVHEAISRITDAITLRALYFNTKGLAALIKHHQVLQEGIFLTAATAKYREKNYGQRSVDHAEVKMKRLIASFKKHGLEFDTLVMSTAWGECDEASLEEQTSVGLQMWRRSRGQFALRCVFVRHESLLVHCVVTP